MNSQFYIKPNLVIEPLIQKWYAWTHLISPATAAMNVVGRHLKIMQSYIQAAHIHAAAVKNPKMRGGPFIDLGGEKVEEIKHLLDKTRQEQKKLIELAAAIRELDKMLKTHAKGYSLDPLYAKVPTILQGYVELFYDLNNTPSYRFFESLLYKSEFYDESSQSIALWLTNNDERPFCLSTPRVQDENILHLNIPFKNAGIDLLSKMKLNPGTIEDVAEAIGVTSDQMPLFKTFFTEEAPRPYPKYKGDKIRMRYFGHACILVETNEVSVLLDPIISYYGYPTEIERFSDLHLPEEIDYVLITHNHQDHILLETLLPLRHKIKNVIIPKSGVGFLQDPNLKMVFENMGFRNVVELSEMESLDFFNCSIFGIPFIGEHSDLNIQTKLCYKVTLHGFAMGFMADSCNVESKLYQHVCRETGPMDVLFLGMECDGAPLTWLYGPLLTEELGRDKDQSRRLAGSNFERARDIVDIFKPKELYVYAMGQEPWLEFISSIKYTEESNPIIASNKVIQYCQAKGLIAERLFGEKEILYSRV